MGSVVSRPRFSRKTKVGLGIFAAYFIAAIAFVYFGLQPATRPEEVYAKEAEQATTTLSLNLSTKESQKDQQDIPVKTVAKIGKDLEVPEQIVGAYSAHQNKTLLIGHSSTAFSNLKDLQLGDTITYSGKNYTITDIAQKMKQDIDMKEILKAESEDTIVLMTCSGDKNGDDYTHRLIVTAV